MLITPEQIRAARALLRLEQAELAERAHVPLSLLQDFESVGGMGKVAPSKVDEIARALEEAGVEFIARGVRRRERTAEEKEALRRRVEEISARSAALFKDAPPFSEDDLYDENGLPA